MFVLFVVLVRLVFFFYFNCSLWIRDFVYGIVYFRMVIFSLEIVFLLWIREGSDDRFGAWFELNYFVFLFFVIRNGKG